MRDGLKLFSYEGERKYLNWPEREAFFQVVRSGNNISEMAFCLTLFYAGCRISEALETNGNRFDASERIMVFRTLKQRDRHDFRIIQIPSELADLLQKVAKNKGAEDIRLWGFSRTTGYRIIKHYMKEAGIEGIKACPKGLRHSFAVAYITRGVPITTLQRWMGHKNLETTAIYLNVIGEEDRQQAEKIWNTV